MRRRNHSVGVSGAGSDGVTVSAYDRDASAFATSWHEQPLPIDLYETVRLYFQPGITADIGCGSGRDVAWLNASGFPAVGYDASAGLLTEARGRYPGLKFMMSSLPDLSGITNLRFDNVLCETVIMHLPHEGIEPSIKRMLTILRPGGVLYLSWRVIENERRDNRGRLYTVLETNDVRAALVDADLMLDEQFTSASSGNLIHRIIARKN